MSGLETKIVQGIKVTINPATLTDWDVLTSLVTIASNDESADASEEDLVKDSSKKMKAIGLLTDTIFGKDQFETIKKELRAKNDGLLPIEAIVKFISSVFDVFQGKKS